MGFPVAIVDDVGKLQATVIGSRIVALQAIECRKRGFAGSAWRPRDIDEPFLKKGHIGRWLQYLNA
jgi:hypothetical protein